MRKKLLIGIALCVVLSLIIVVTSESSPSRFIQSKIQSVYMSPKATLYEFAASIEEQNELDKLRLENAQLREKLVEIDHLKKDNEALRSQFESEQIEKEKLVPASVVGFHGSVHNPQIIIINRGSEDSIQKGQAVITENNLIGVIDTTTARYSSVIVVTNPSFSTVAKTGEDALGVVQGAEDFMLFDRVAITSELEEGSTVVTRGNVNDQAVGVPPNLILGKIENVRKVESEPFQSAQIKSLVNIGSITRVFVII